MGSIQDGKVLIMSLVGVILLITSGVVTGSSSISSADLLAAEETSKRNGYEMTERDRKVIAQAKNEINRLVERLEKEKLVRMTGVVMRYTWMVDDNGQDAFLLAMIEALLVDALEDVIDGYESDESSAVADFLAGRIAIDNTALQDELSNDSDGDASSQNDTAWSQQSVGDGDETVVSSVGDTNDDSDTENAWSTSDSSAGSSTTSSTSAGGSSWAGRIDWPVPPAPPTPDRQLSPEEFLDAYYPFLMDTNWLVWRCYEHYDAIDQRAKERDFPTSLIIATRFREHSCYMSNPWNGYGNFQITSHHYPPGEIELDELLRQVDHFIDFSHAKRDWYDAIQVFGPEPVAIAYDSFDLNSIRKQAILYNGVYPNVTLTNSWYSNENFTQSRWWRDGVVAVLIKVLDRARENWKF